MLTAFGVAALSFMMLMYALEHRGRGFVLRRRLFLGERLRFPFGIVAVRHHRGGMGSHSPSQVHLVERRELEGEKNAPEQSIPPPHRDTLGASGARAARGACGAVSLGP